MTVYYIYDNNGTEAIPFLQLKEPYTVDDFIDIDISDYIRDKNLGNNIEMYNTYLTMKEYFVDFEISDLGNLTATHLTTLDMIYYRDNSTLELTDGNSTVKIKVTRGNSSGNYIANYVVNADSGYPLREPLNYVEFNGIKNIMGTLSSQQRWGSIDSGKYSETPVIIRDYSGRIKTLLTSRYIDNEEYNNTGIYYSEVLLIKSGYQIDGLYDWGNIPANFWNSLGNSFDGPKVKEEGIVNVNKRYSPRVQSNGVGLYPITASQLTEFVSDLWEKTFLENINTVVNGDAMNNVLSLRWFYGIGPSIPRTEAYTYLTLGNVNFNGVLTQSSVTTRPAKTDMLTYSMGSISINRAFNNFLDLSPFTKTQIYIPYVGFSEIDTTSIMGRKIRLDYNINIATGGAIAYVYVQTGENSWRIIQEHPCMMGVDIPLNIQSSEGLGSRIASSIAGSAAGMLSLGMGAAAGPMGIAGSVMGQMAGGMVSNSLNSVQSISGQSSVTVGGLSSETGSLGEFQPHVVITRPQPKAPAGYNSMIGKPDYRNVNIGSMSGYIKIGAISKGAGAGNQNIPKEAMDEIDQLLKAGVYTR